MESQAPRPVKVRRQPVIAIVGSANIDLTTYASVLPNAGETLTGTSFTEGFGGKGANQAAMAALAGGYVHFVGAVGSDAFGQNLINNFHHYGIDTSAVATPPTSSGIAHIWVDGAGENRILIIPGANGAIYPNEVSVTIANIPQLDIVVAQCEIPQEANLAAFKAAKARGAITILNPAPYQKLSDELLQLTDWLIPNESEFAQMDSQGRLPNSDEVISSLRPDKNLIVTLGSAGVAIATPGNSVIRVPSRKVVAIDSTGAGDCFIGAFSAGIGIGLLPEEAAAFAAQCAALSVTKKGTQSSYPTGGEVEDILREINPSVLMG